MSELIVLLLSLSISASLITVLLLALRPLYRSRLSRTWQYYIWLVVVVRLLLPFAPETNLMGYVFDRAEQSAADRTLPEDRELTVDDAEISAAPPQVAAVEEADHISAQASATVSPRAFLVENLLTIWLVVALVLFVRKLTSYVSFVRYIRAGRRETDDPEILDAYFTACEEAGIKKPLPLYENKLASSPMLVGILRPCIVLPELRMDMESLRLILRHELVHYKRRDILYKWLVQLALCVHWFNPLVYLAAREIDRCCELSCDEAVIGRMAEADRRQYGDTLLATLQSGGAYGGVVASITMTEDGRNLKERLQAIVRLHPGSRGTRAAAAALSVALLLGASYAGAYAGGRRAAGPAATEVSAVSDRQYVEQTAAAPLILRRGEYTHLVTASRGATVSVPFQANGPQTSLYVVQEGEGSFSLQVWTASGEAVATREGVAFQDGGEPVLVFSSRSGTVCSLELSIPGNGPDSVAVYGAGMSSAGENIPFSLPRIPELVGSMGENIAMDVVDKVLEQTVGDIEKWAAFGEKWAEKWDDSFETNSGESWYYLNYKYEDGYLVGAGVRKNNSASWLTETITLNGRDYTLAYTPDAAEYRDNTKVKALITGIVTDIAGKSGRGTAARIFDQFTVRSVIYNPDPQALLRQLYAERAFAEFYVVVEHCEGLPVIEELLLVAAADEEELYFKLLADRLPDSFDASALARQAVEKRNIIMLSALERFLPERVYGSMMNEAMGFEFDYQFE